jgi:hypothetical protein
MVCSESSVGFAVERFMVSRIYLHCLLRKRTVEETEKVEIVVEEEVVVIIHVDNS